MIVIDVVHAAIGVTQLGGDVVQLVESLVREPPHGATGEVGFEQATAAVDGVQLLKVKGCDGGAASGRVDHQALGFENPQRVSDGNEAHPQLLGDRQDHGTDAPARTSTRSHRPSVAERRRYAIDPGPC